MQGQGIMKSSASILDGRESESQSRWYFATNQMNLLYMLAAGMIMPPRGFGEKYYEDSLNVVPGWIPFFSGPIPRDVLGAAVRENRNLMPVIVLLNLSSLKGNATAVSLNGKIRDIALPDDLIPMHPCILVPAPIPTSFIECVYFGSNEEKKAFEQDAADYANVPIALWKRQVKKTLFKQPGRAYWPEGNSFRADLNVPMDTCQAAGGMMAMLLNFGNLGTFSMLACEVAFDGLRGDEKALLDGTVLEGLAHWMHFGMKASSKNVLNDLYWGIVNEIVENRSDSSRSIATKDTILNYLEQFKEKTETKYGKALSDLIMDLKALDQFGAKNTTELLESHPKEVRRALILFFLYRRCSELIEFSHSLLTEQDYIAAALLFAVREKWIGMPLELRDFPGADRAISHRMAQMAHQISKTGLHLGPPPPRCRPLRELLATETDIWTKKQIEAALYLARAMKWPCIRTQVRIGKGDYRLSIDTGGISIDFPGEVKAVDVQIEREAFFKMMGTKPFIEKKIEGKVRSLLPN